MVRVQLVIHLRWGMFDRARAISSVFERSSREWDSLVRIVWCRPLDCAFAPEQHARPSVYHRQDWLEKKLSDPTPRRSRFFQRLTDDSSYSDRIIQNGMSNRSKDAERQCWWSTNESLTHLGLVATLIGEERRIEKKSFNWILLTMTAQCWSKANYHIVLFSQC